VVLLELVEWGAQPIAQQRAEQAPATHEQHGGQRQVAGGQGDQRSVAPGTTAPSAN
jgi:hypothetical protein